MSFDKIKKYLGFPLEEEYRCGFEQETCRHILVIEKFVCSFILLFQLLMMVLMSIKSGGPFVNSRRTWYFAMYVALLTATLLLKLFCYIFQRRKMENYKLCSRLFIVYSIFLGAWSCVITMIDQMGGSGLSVYSYVIVTIAVFSVVKPWQSAILFGSCFVFLNMYLPAFQQGSNSAFGNIMNSMFITILSIFISCIFYRNRVFQYYDRIIIKKQYNEILLINKKLKKLVITDELTSMNNRRYLEENMHIKLMNSQSHKSVAGMMVDIDYFKQYNDSYGHLEGDLCLKKIAGVLLEFEKQENIHAVRYGGEEFFVCIFDCDKQGALKKAEEIRARIEACDFQRTDTLIGCVTVSIGVCAMTPPYNLKLEEFVGRADLALYQAKDAGRNRVAFYNSP